MDMLEDMVAFVINEISGDFKFKYGENIIDFTPPWQRLDLRKRFYTAASIYAISRCDFAQERNVKTEYGSRPQ